MLQNTENELHCTTMPTEWCRWDRDGRKRESRGRGPAETMAPRYTVYAGPVSIVSAGDLHPCAEGCFISYLASAGCLAVVLIVDKGLLLCCTALHQRTITAPPSVQTSESIFGYEEEAAAQVKV